MTNVLVLSTVYTGVLTTLVGSLFPYSLSLTLSVYIISALACFYIIIQELILLDPT